MYNDSIASAASTHYSICSHCNSELSSVRDLSIVIEKLNAQKISTAQMIVNAKTSKTITADISYPSPLEDTPKTNLEVNTSFCFGHDDRIHVLPKHNSAM